LADHAYISMQEFAMVNDITSRVYTARGKVIELGVDTVFFQKLE